MPFAHKRFAKLRVIFNNSIVHRVNTFRAICVRMGIFIRRTTMRRPTGVRDCNISDFIGPIFSQDFAFERRNPPGSFFMPYFYAVPQRNPGRIVPTIFLILKPF